jgi:hypothetical protein
LEELLDEQGFPAGRHLSIVRPLLACWTRAQLMDRRLERDSVWRNNGEASGMQGVRHKRSRRQFKRFVRHALRLTRVDGSQVFSEPPHASLAKRSSVVDPDKRDRRLFEAALQLASGRKNRRLALLLRARRSPSDERELPAAAAHSEKAGLAILRRDWSSGDQLAVHFDGEAIHTECQAEGRVLWSGCCQPEVRIDGRLLAGERNWSELCWVSDDDLDYLELQLQFADGVQVQRHMLLAREDRFLLMADAVLGHQPGRIDYRLALPLARGVTFAPAQETREGRFAIQNEPRHLALPLGLPEWRQDHRPGALQSAADGLDLRQIVSGQALWAPLFIDLSPRRRNKPFTWRQLTVAENRQAVPSDVAHGCRVQIGKKQWVIYRSLGPTGNRTVLGINLVSEFLVARFHKNGETENLLEIE